MKSMYNTKNGKFNASVGMDIAFASIFVLAIGLTVANDIVTQVTTGNDSVTGTSATVLGYVTLVIGAGFLYVVARMTGVL